MSIENHVPDGTFVEAVAKLVHPEYRLVDAPNGQKLLIGGNNPELYGIPSLPAPGTIRLATLDGIIEAYKELQESELKYDVIIHVSSPCDVLITAPRVGDKSQVFIYYGAQAIVPDIQIGEYLDMDMAILNLNANFDKTEDRENLLQMLGSVTSGLAADIVDDGVAQQVTTKRGITRAQESSVKNPVVLRPYRTFSEINQPSSPFVVRLKQIKEAEDNLTAKASLHEADGGRWRVEAIQDIAAYLSDRLPDAVILA